VLPRLSATPRSIFLKSSVSSSTCSLRRSKLDLHASENQMQRSLFADPRLYVAVVTTLEHKPDKVGIEAVSYGVMELRGTEVVLNVAICAHCDQKAGCQPLLVDD